jgi:hypothetical protein
MTGIEGLIEAIELQRQYNGCLSVRWVKVIELVLADRKLTLNEIGRMLGLTRKEMPGLRQSMHRLKYIGRVRKYGIRFELTGKTARYYTQRELEEYF